MGEYMFGHGNGLVAGDVADRVDAIARECGASFVPYREPTGVVAFTHHYWFATTSEGHDRNLIVRDAVIAALTDAGLWPVPVLTTADTLSLDAEARAIVDTAGDIDEVRRIADKGWPAREGQSADLCAAVQERAREVVGQAEASDE